MRQALQRSTQAVKTAVNRSVPAPTGGWDTESPIAKMPAKNAVLLDNMIPRAADCVMRKGYMQQTSGFTDPVETLIAWRGDAAGDKLFACSGASIYDVTDSGALGSAVWTASASSFSARFKSTNFANDAGAFAIAVNGVNVPLRYTGTAFAELTITGSVGSITLDPTKLSDVMSHKRRLHFIEKDTLRVWFLETSAIQGAAGLLDLGPVFNKGGRLIAEGTWTLDGGQGPDDMAVYITTKGQVAIFQGLDPADADNWSLIGVYDLAEPIGDRCLIKWGSDLAIITRDGVVPLSQALNKDRAQDDLVALTAKVASAFSKSASSYGSLFGWSGLLYSASVAGSIAIVNVPTEEGASAVQYVQSMINGSWCRFTGLNAICWEVANGNLYFGAAEAVYQADTGSTDDGEIIVADVKPAFSNFGYAANKQFTSIRPLMKAPAIIKPALEILTDYQERIPTAVPTVVEAGDISDEDSDAIRGDWTGATGLGYVGAPRMRIAIQGAADVDRLSYDGADLLLTETGGDYLILRPSLPLEVDVELIGFDVMFIPGGAI